MKKILFALLFIVVVTHSDAQSSSNMLFSNGDEINIVLSGDSDYFYYHEMKKGQSLYALSKTFNLPVDRLYRENGLKKDATISIGQQIKIPVKDEYLYKGVSLSGLKHGHYIPVYYKTMPKDNLFRISRIYFNQPTDDLMNRNGLDNNNLSLGQKLLVGWLPLGNTASTEVSSTIEQEDLRDEFEEDFGEDDLGLSGDSNLEMDQIENQDSLEEAISYPEGFNVSLLGMLSYSKNMKQVSKSEVAHWDKSMPDNGMVYVLHQDAILDSYINMYNPIIKRSVRAKVIGRIPYGAYTKDVRLVLSPRTAKQLGALDRRFKVEVKALVYDVD